MTVSLSLVFFTSTSARLDLELFHSLLSFRKSGVTAKDQDDCGFTTVWYQGGSTDVVFGRAPWYLSTQELQLALSGSYRKHGNDKTGGRER